MEAKVWRVSDCYGLDEPTTTTTRMSWCGAVASARGARGVTEGALSVISSGVMALKGL